MWSCAVFWENQVFCARKRRNDEQRKPVDEKEKGKSARGVKSRGKISAIFLNYQLISQLFSHYFWKYLIISGFQKTENFYDLYFLSSIENQTVTKLLGKLLILAVIYFVWNKRTLARAMYCEVFLRMDWGDVPKRRVEWSGKCSKMRRNVARNCVFSQR